MVFFIGVIQVKSIWEQKEEKEQVKEKPTKTKSRGTKTTNKHLFKRFTSEKALEECLDWYAQKGCAYHVISMGDIDSLSFLKWALRQTKVKKLIVSTWCMSLQDCDQFEQWLDIGVIENIDFYVGEIFPGSYSREYKKLKEICSKYEGSVCVFRNHSKIFAGYGDNFNFVIESSANINTNPRTEQTVITIDDGLVDFYTDFFSKIKSFDKSS